MSAQDASAHELTLLREMTRQQQATIEDQQRRLSQLEHQLALLLRAHCGPKSEKVDPAQLALFEIKPAAEEPLTKSIAAEQTVREHVRQGGGRKALPAELPRRRVEHSLPEHELACPCCGQQRTKFSEEISEQLEFVPASLHVIQHVRFKYACTKCQEQVVTAAKPPQPIEKGIPGPGLLAAIITSKFGDHLPLYRLEDVFARHGVDLSRSTMCGWLKQTAELLQPLYKAMCRLVLQSRVIHTDDTKVPVLDPSLPHVRNSRFWVYLGDELHPYVVFDYTRSRERDDPAQFLAGYEGYVQADAFSAYDGIYTGSGGNCSAAMTAAAERLPSSTPRHPPPNDMAWIPSRGCVTCSPSYRRCPRTPMSRCFACCPIKTLFIERLLITCRRFAIANRFLCGDPIRARSQ